MEQTLVILPKTFGSPKSVVEYLGRYTHKLPLAIIESGVLTFKM
jgi:hypothetical protein